MVDIKRYFANPILEPNKQNDWEKEAAFNGCIAEGGKDLFHFVYRAQSQTQTIDGNNLELSTIGYAKSSDRIHFKKRRQLITPEFDWEKFGLEDPRLTCIDNKYYIFYTALSDYPHSPAGIKIAVALTSDFKKIEEKHQVTHFNSKAMALFPEKINGKLTAVLTVHTDMPPAKIAIAQFDNPAQIWDQNFWQNWYNSLDTHTLNLLRSSDDHIEVGAPPIKTASGWLLIYSYIKNYRTQYKTFGIEAILLDPTDPTKIISRTQKPLLTPQENYELQGKVPNVIFPSGALVHENELGIYYGAADTTCCLATCNLDELLNDLTSSSHIHATIKIKEKIVERFAENPIISPIPEHEWESKATFNPTAIYEGGKVHIIYRAMSQDDTSTLGYAQSSDGFHIDERLPLPIYVPREEFEVKAQKGNSGCEDPRITKIGDQIYMTYTAFNAKDQTHVALTSISTRDFLKKNWKWTKPVSISPLGIDDKNACILPEKINGKYVIFHRINPRIWVDFVDDLNLGGEKLIKGIPAFEPRIDKWDSNKVGIAAPPIKTAEGWLLIYHGVSEADHKYRLGAMLLELNNPTQAIARTNEPILEPEMEYEAVGLTPNVVFCCGAVVIGENLLIYYGGGDKVVGVAAVNLNLLLSHLLRA